MRSEDEDVKKIAVVNDDQKIINVRDPSKIPYVIRDHNQPSLDHQQTEKDSEVSKHEEHRGVRLTATIMNDGQR